MRYVRELTIVAGVLAALALSMACSDDEGEAGPAAGGSSSGITGGTGGVGGTGGTAGAGASGTAGAGGVDDRCSYQRGWTEDVRGGLDGIVIPVTTLDRDGPGSLSEALATEGPRVIVFEVGGVIDLELQSMRIRDPHVTVAGQTAPSPGITLIRGTLSISTYDVVVQHIRVRPGEAGQSSSWEPDGISVTSSYDVIIDHCSVSWSIDENLSASGPRFDGATPDEWRQNTSHRVTFIRNIVAEALNDSTHSKGPHSKGSLIHDNATDIFIYGNLYASNVDRNPLFKGGVRGVIVNNFITNPGSKAASYGLVESEWDTFAYETGQMSLVGNVYHHGLDTSSDAPLLRAGGVGTVDVFVDDNIAEDLAGNSVPTFGGNTDLINEVTSPPSWPAGFTAQPAASILPALRDDVGARPWDRDAIDARIVQEAFDGTGRQIDHETDVEGYPNPTPTAAPFVAAEWDDCFDRVD